jgi:Flp pilus assembly protein TadG
MNRIPMRPQRRRRGAAIVEAAVVLPMLLLLVFGALEYGWMFVVQGSIVNAARQGARAGINPGATAANVQNQIAVVLQNAGLGASGYTTSISPNVSSAASGTVLFITVTVPYQNVSLTHFPLLPTPTVLQSTVAMTKEGPSS